MDFALTLLPGGCAARLRTPLAKHLRSLVLAALSAWIAQGVPNAPTLGLARTGLPISLAAKWRGEGSAQK